MKPYLLALLFAASAANAAPFTPEQEARIRELVRETLVQNPTILDEAAQTWQSQQEAAYEAQLAELLKDKHKLLFDSPSSPRIGAKKPKLSLVFFTDFNCGYCKQYEPVLDKLLKQYPDVDVVIKYLPFQGPSSMTAAQLALTLWQQKGQAFKPLHDKLVAKKGALDDAAIQTALKLTGNQGLIASNDSAREININMQLAQDFGIQGTPATLVGGQLLPGAINFEQLEQVLLTELEKL